MLGKRIKKNDLIDAFYGTLVLAAMLILFGKLATLVGY